MTLGRKQDDSKKNLVKFTPLKILGLYNPSIEFGYERVISKTFTTQATASLLLPYSIPEFLINGSSFKYQGFRLGLEQRYYIKKNAPQGIYIGFETDYLKNQYHTIENFISSEKNKAATIGNYDHGYPDTIKVHKQFWGFQFKFGKQFTKRNVFIDMYAGAGLRIKKVSFSEKINPDDIMINKNHHDITSYFRKDGIVYAPSIPVNFRLGYRF